MICSLCKVKSEKMCCECDCGFKICKECFETLEPLFEKYGGRLCCIFCRVHQKKVMFDLCYQIRYKFYYLPDKPISYFKQEIDRYK